MSEWDDLAEMVDRPPHDKPAGQGVHLLRVNTKGSAIGREHGRLGRMLANHHKVKAVSLAKLNLPDLPSE